MANEQNLVPQSMRNEEDRKRIGRIGGKASAEARRRKKTMQQALETLLNSTILDKGGKEASGTEALCAVLFQKALKGDLKAWEMLRDTAGQKPKEQTETTATVTNIDASKLTDAQLDRILGGDEDAESTN